jgi:hypothetical protein
MIYIQANRGMYGLPQSGLLANELLEKQLNKIGYHQSMLVPGLWSHTWRPVHFTLVIDDFRVKYVGKKHAIHLKQNLKENYKLTLKWDGQQYIGITLDWDYNRQQVHTRNCDELPESSLLASNELSSQPLFTLSSYHDKIK